MPDRAMSSVLGPSVTRSGPASGKAWPGRVHLRAQYMPLPNPGPTGLNHFQISASLNDAALDELLFAELSEPPLESTHASWIRER